MIEKELDLALDPSRELSRQGGNTLVGTLDEDIGILAQHLHSAPPQRLHGPVGLVHPDRPPGGGMTAQVGRGPWYRRRPRWITTRFKAICSTSARMWLDRKTVAQVCL